MPTDAPDGLINAHVVQGRRSDHKEPKAARTSTHEPKADAPAEDKAKDDDKAKPVKAADKKAADKG